MNIIEKRIDDLIMYENNPKIHTDEQINKIAKSIELTKGLRQPIVIDKNSKVYMWNECTAKYDGKYSNGNI